MQKTEQRPQQKQHSTLQGNLGMVTQNFADHNTTSVDQRAAQFHSVIATHNRKSNGMLSN